MRRNLRGSLWLLFVPFLLGMGQINNTYTEEQAIYTDIKNIYDNGQDQQFTQVTSTPPYQSMKDGQFFIYVSTPNPLDVTVMLRVGTTVYVSPNWSIMKGR